MDVSDGQVELGFCFCRYVLLDLRQDLVIEVVRVHVGLFAGAAQLATVGAIRRSQDGREIEPFRFPMLDGRGAAEPIYSADHLVERAESQLGHNLPGFLGHERHEADQVLHLAGKAFSQVGILRGDSHGAGSQVALPHQQATQRNECRGAEPESLGPQQGGNHHIAAGAELPVGLHENPIPQAVADQSLLRLGQPDFPRGAGMFDRRERAGPGAAVVAADEHFVGIPLGHTRRDRADANLRDQLHRDLHARVAAL